MPWCYAYRHGQKAHFLILLLSQIQSSCPLSKIPPFMAVDTVECLFDVTLPEVDAHTWYAGRATGSQYTAHDLNASNGRPFSLKCFLMDST